ncbi:MAG: VWA domain-containing protein [Deltaproteobacteria bacterium]|nr:VWA domain-containing protein [Deltaproteobacteria bacterium]
MIAVSHKTLARALLWVTCIAAVLLLSFLPVRLTLAVDNTCLAVDGENSSFEDAVPLQGQFCRTGSILKSEERIFFRLQLASSSAQSYWSFQLQALPGQAGRLEIFFVPPDKSASDVARSSSLFSADTSSATGILNTEPLILGSGYFIIAISGSGDGITYKLRGQQVRALPAEWKKVDAVRQDSFSLSSVLPQGSIEIPWEVSDSQILWELVLQSRPGARVSLALVGANGEEIARAKQAADDFGVTRLADLGLESNKYKVVVQGETDVSIALEARAISTHGGMEFSREPDSSEREAHQLTPRIRRSGRLVKRDWYGDSDYYFFDVDEALSKKETEILLRSPSKDSIALQLLDKEGRVMSSAKGFYEIKLSKLVLQPGRYYVNVTGELGLDETYVLGVFDNPAASASSEREPNDRYELAMPIDSTGPISGSLSENDTRDLFKVKIDNGLELWDFEVFGSSVSNLSLIDSSGKTIVQGSSRKGASVIKLPRVLVPQGWRTVAIDGKQGDWIFRAKKIGLPNAGEELEPNNEIARAVHVREGISIKGWLDYGGDIDYHTFFLPAPSRVRIALDSPVDFPVVSQLEWGQAAEVVAEFINTEVSGETQHIIWEGLLEPGDYYLKLRLSNSQDFTTYPYALRVDALPFFVNEQTSVQQPGFSAELKFNAKEVAPFLADAQVIEGVLAIKSLASSQSVIKPKAWIADERWTLKGLPADIKLEPEGEVKLPLALLVSPDARDDWPMRVEINLQSDSEKSESVRVSDIIKVVATAKRAKRFLTPAIPKKLSGGINVAWSVLGATAEQKYVCLIDGIVDGKSVSLPIGEPVVVSLAGTDVRPIVGALFEPAPLAPFRARIKNFKLEISIDGKNYTEVLGEKLSPIFREQGFVFKQPIEARFVRLTALDNYGKENSNTAELSELKIIQDPSLPFDKAVKFNIASPSVGGHVVYASGEPESNLTGDSGNWNKKPIAFPAKREQPIKIVLGFMASRSPQIAEITWEAENSWGSSSANLEFDVSYSIDGPFGPWAKLGRWKVAESNNGVSTFTLGEPLRASNLLIEVLAPLGKRVVLAGRLGVWEQFVDSSYRSILGEWGSDIKQMVSEYGRQSSDVGNVGNGLGLTRENAIKLEQGKSVNGIVRINEAENWYSIELPEKAQAVTFEVKGKPVAEVAIDLLDSNGQGVAVEADPDNPDAYVAKVRPGNYFVRVSQPRRSVVVTWDTSGSVTGFERGIQRVVERLVWDIEPELEAINLIPFQGERASSILRDWTSNPADVYEALADYAWKDDSSNAEGSLLASSLELTNRQGIHAIAVITDAASDGASLNAKLWNEFAAARPRIFALKILTGDGLERTRAQVNLMQDWAALNGGFYSTFSSQGEADVQFRRMAARLRQPSNYSLNFKVRTEPLPPGELVLKASAGAEVRGASPVVEFLIDASGSMLQMIGRERRIDIAKSLIAELAASLPSKKTKVALRAFGHGGRGLCSTELMLPLSEAEPARIRNVASKLRAVDGAKTAIAQSLHAVADDLAGGAGGEGLVVLITDGEETCGGDPRAEILDLKRKGFNVRVNIVGFAVDSDRIRRDFAEWANLGGGEYFHAEDRASLAKAINKSLLASFEIVGADGTLAGRTTIGADPLKIPPGSYGVYMAGNRDRVLKEIEIFSGKRLSVEIE